MVTRRRPGSKAIAARAALAGSAALLALAWGGARAAADQADASGLDRARAELGELRYEDALATLRKTLAAGTGGPAATAQIYLLMGEVRASLGQDGAAAKAFQRALALDAELELRKGVSPKISAPFRRARRARRRSGPLAIAHRIVREDPITIAVLVQSDPLRMVTGARIVYWSEDGTSRSVASGKGGARRKARAEARFDLELPRGAKRFTVAGIDRHGNRLVELGTEDRPLSLDIDSGGARPAGASVATAGEDVAAAPADPQPAAILEPRDGGPERPPLHAHWLLWGGVALGIGAAGTWAGITAQSAADELDDIRATEYEVEFSEARRVADRAEQRSLVANICFAAAGASAIASTILYLRGRHRAEEAAALAPVIGHDHLGLAVSARF
jgi:hypothetical protein